MNVSTVMIINMWMIPTWIPMKEIYFHPVTPILEMARAKSKTKRKYGKIVKSYLLSKDIVIASAHQIAMTMTSCTCIHLGEYRACKAAETELKVQHCNNKHMK
eukprot:2719227-Ditylum_brightwellii.AAC.1